MKIHCPYDKLVNVADLKPHTKNRNDHPKDQITRLAQILEYQGFRYPIKVSKLSGFVTSGHGRIEAAKINGWTEVPVSYQEYESEAQEYADLIADNSIASWSELDLSGINSDICDLGPDFDINLLGIKDFEIEVADKIGECDEDEVPEPKESITKLGDLWILGNHRLLCGDSTDILQVEKLMNGEKADMVFTDPPYLMSKVGGGLADERPNWKKYQDNGLADFNPQDFISILQVLSVPTLYVFCSKDLLKQYIQYFEDSERSWNLLVMAKNNPIPMKNNTFLSDTEWLFFSRGDNAIFNNNLDYDYYRKVFNVSVKSSEFGHPTEKRVNIIERFLEISSNKNGNVLDLFGGSGSTLIACEKTNRKCFMMELDTHYCDVICERFMKYSGKEVYLLEPDGNKKKWSEVKR